MGCAIGCWYRRRDACTCRRDVWNRTAWKKINFL